MDDAVIEWFDSHCHLQDEFTEADAGDRIDATGPRASPLAGALAGAVLALAAGWWGLRDVLRRPVVDTLRRATT